VKVMAALALEIKDECFLEVMFHCGIEVVATARLRVMASHQSAV
jgi:hypothetical protein